MKFTAFLLTGLAFAESQPEQKSETLSSNIQLRRRTSIVQLPDPKTVVFKVDPGNLSGSANSSGPGSVPGPGVLPSPGNLPVSASLPGAGGAPGPGNPPGPGNLLAPGFSLALGVLPTYLVYPSIAASLFPIVVQNGSKCGVFLKMLCH